MAILNSLSSKVSMDISWAGRRRVVRLTLLSCLGLAIYSMWLGPAMAGIVFPSVATLSGAVIGSYVFGAAWERTSGIPSANVEVKKNVDVS